MASATSLESYNLIKPQIGKRQKQVLDAITDLKICTAHDIAQWMYEHDMIALPTTKCVTPRIVELLKSEHIEKCGMADKIIAKRMTLYRLTGSDFLDYTPNKYAVQKNRREFFFANSLCSQALKYLKLATSHEIAETLHKLGHIPFPDNLYAENELSRLARKGTAKVVGTKYNESTRRTVSLYKYIEQ